MDDMTLEQMLESLEEIVEKLDDEDISLDDAFAEYSKGVKLVKECNKSIDRVEKKVQILMDNGECGDFE